MTRALIIKYSHHHPSLPVTRAFKFIIKYSHHHRPSLPVARVFKFIVRYSHHHRHPSLPVARALEFITNWDTTFSGFVRLLCGIRQGGVLSPYLFIVFIDSTVDKVRISSLGCYVKYVSLSILLYADDIVLLSPSVSSLQKLLEIC